MNNEERPKSKVRSLKPESWRSWRPWRHVVLPGVLLDEPALHQHDSIAAAVYGTRLKASCVSHG
jgi:hypothetical protein